MRRLALALACVGCAPVSDDPAEGGFFNGVAGLAGGGYEARVGEREQAVASAEAQGAALTAELDALQGEHAALKTRIVQQRAALRAARVRLTPATEGRIQAVVAAQPANRVADLERAIADARTLSGQLAGLAG
jgi:hypothetical protein